MDRIGNRRPSPNDKRAGTAAALFTDRAFFLGTDSRDRFGVDLLLQQIWKTVSLSYSYGFTQWTCASNSTWRDGERSRVAVELEFALWEFLLVLYAVFAVEVMIRFCFHSCGIWRVA